MRRTQNDSFFRVSLVSFLYFASLSSAFSPTLALCAKARGAGHLEIGLLYAFSGLFGTMMRLPSGSLSNLWGRRPFVLLGGLSCVISPLIFSLSLSRSGLWLGSAFYSLAFLYAPSALSLMHDSLAEHQKTKLLSFYTISGGVGRAIGPLLAGGLLQWRHSYEEVFLASALLASAGFLISIALRDFRSSEDRKKDLQNAHVSHQVKSEMLSIFKQPALAATTFLRLLQSMVMGVFNAYFPLLAVGPAGLTPGSIGLAQGTLILSSLGARGFLSQKNRSTKSLFIIQSVATAFCGVCLVLIGQKTGVWIILGACALLGFLEGLSHVANLIFVSERVGKKLFSPTITLHSSASDVGLLGGRVLPGVLIFTLGVGFSGSFLAIGMGVCLLSAWALFRYE